MGKKKLLLTIKILSLIPRPIQKFLGYSFLGTKLLQNLKGSGSKATFDIQHGLKIYLELSNPFTWDLVLGKDLEEDVKEEFSQNINEGDTVIDVGANIGEYTLLGAKLAGDKGLVISVEPDHNTVKSLKENIILNDFKNCLVLEKAVGDKVEMKSLYKESEEGVIGYLDSHIVNKELKKHSEIEVTTIDEIISSKNLSLVNLLKIDVEGFEYEVLLGCNDALKKNKIKKIIIELHPKYLKYKGIDEDLIYTFLRKYGFNIKKIQEKLTAGVNSRQKFEGETGIRTSNILAIKN
tara:strand:- start:683 stop:1561 length:879 start_codon:yes stop_codon:yes gene_type:complete